MENPLRALGRLFRPRSTEAVSGNAIGSFENPGERKQPYTGDLINKAMAPRPSTGEPLTQPGAAEALEGAANAAIAGKPKTAELLAADAAAKGMSAPDNLQQVAENNKAKIDASKNQTSVNSADQKTA